MIRQVRSYLRRRRSGGDVYSAIDYLKDYGVPPEVTDQMSDAQIIAAARDLRRALQADELLKKDWGDVWEDLPDPDAEERSQ